MNYKSVQSCYSKPGTFCFRIEQKVPGFFTLKRQLYFGLQGMVIRLVGRTVHQSDSADDAEDAQYHADAQRLVKYQNPQDGCKRCADPGPYRIGKA